MQPLTFVYSYEVDLFTAPTAFLLVLLWHLQGPITGESLKTLYVDADNVTKLVILLHRIVAKLATMLTKVSEALSP